MAFQIKSFRSIVASMVNVARASQSDITDFSVGSVARTLVESPAVEIEELYLQMLLGLLDAIPTSVFKSFDFELLPAKGASGLVRFTNLYAAESPILIPAGTIIATTNGVNYSTGVAVSIAVGQTFVDVLVAADTPGLVTNAVIGSEMRVVSTLSEPLSVTNINAFTDGADIETDDKRKARFTQYVTTLSRGTVDALRYGVSQAVVLNASGGVVERAKHALIYEPYLTDALQPVAWVKVYVHNGEGGTSAALLASVSQTLHGYYKADGTPVPGWKAAGVKVDVLAATEVSVAVTGVVTMDAGYSKTAAIAQAEALIRAYVNGLGVGKPVIQSEIVSLIMNIPGVYNVVLSAPLVDVAVSQFSKAMTGEITLT